MITQCSMIWECGVHMVMVTLFTIFQNQNSIKINSNSKCKTFQNCVWSKLDFYSQMFNVVSDFGPHCIYCIYIYVCVWDQSGKRKEKKRKGQKRAKRKKEANNLWSVCRETDGVKQCLISDLWPLSLCCTLYWRESLIITLLYSIELLTSTDLWSINVHMHLYTCSNNNKNYNSSHSITK